MIIVHVTWCGDHAAYIRDPVRRGKFVCGIECNEFGIGMRHEGCTEDAELRIERDRITSYQEAVMA